MAKKQSKSVTLRKIADFKFVSGLVVVFFLAIGIFTALKINSGSVDVTAEAAGCTLGSKTCQGGGGTTGNSGYQCTCVAVASGNVWSCGTYNTQACPVGAATPTPIATNPAVKCTAANGTTYSIGQGVCTTLNGKTTGDYCTCFDVSSGGIAKGDWKCAMNTSKCSVQVIDPAYIVNNTVKASACSAPGVTTDGNCLKLAGATISKYYCPNDTSASMSSGGCQQNGTTAIGSQCFSNICGTQQLDVKTSLGNCYMSTFVPCSSSVTPAPTKVPVTSTPLPTKPLLTITSTSTVTPTKTPTPTPTIPTKTPTPTPVLVCRAMRAFDKNNLDITAKLDTIKMGDNVTFRGYADNTQTAVSMTFVASIDGKEVQREVVPVKLVGTDWVASFPYNFTKFGSHSVKIISINK